MKLWDARTLGLETSLTGHTAAVWTVAFSPDGRHLATASSDGTARVWDARDRRRGPQARRREPRHRDRGVAPGRRRELATTGWDRTRERGVWGVVKVWSADGTLVRSLEHGVKPIVTSSWSPDGTRFYVGTWDDDVAVWDTATWADAVPRRPAHVRDLQGRPGHRGEPGRSASRGRGEGRDAPRLGPVRLPARPHARGPGRGPGPVGQRHRLASRGPPRRRRQRPHRAPVGRGSGPPARRPPRPHRLGHQRRRLSRRPTPLHGRGRRHRPRLGPRGPRPRAVGLAARARTPTASPSRRTGRARRERGGGAGCACGTRRAAASSRSGTGHEQSGVRVAWSPDGTVARLDRQRRAGRALGRGFGASRRPPSSRRRARSAASPSARTARSSPPPPGRGTSGSGRCRAAPFAPRSPRATAPSGTWPGAPTGRPSRPRATTGRRSSGTGDRAARGPVSITAGAASWRTTTRAGRCWPPAPAAGASPCGTRRPARSSASARATPRRCDAVAFSPDGARLATGGSDNALRLWDWRSCANVLTVPFALDRLRRSPGARTGRSSSPRRSTTRSSAWRPRPPTSR